VRNFLCCKFAMEMFDTDSKWMAPRGLLDWFRAEARELPWRRLPAGKRDPWQTLLCEVMSQQTRLEVVERRFLEWMDSVPTPDALAAKSGDEVLALWAGLGYYARARNLHALAKLVASSGWPMDSVGLAKLPGVGPYTAAAVASLCFGESVAAVDGNVERVLSRVALLAGDLRKGSGKTALAGLADDWISSGHAGIINEATMELGARVCVPRQPKCHICPLAQMCQANRFGVQAQYPERRVRPATVDVSDEILVVTDSRCAILLRMAGPDELLSGLWTLPRLADHICGILTEIVKIDPEPMSGSVRHAITNHRIRWNLWTASAVGPAPEGFVWAFGDDLDSKVVSSLPRKALELAGRLSARA
jgi:A/G-specific adenine glycosylase